MSAFRLSMLGAIVAGIPFQLAHASAVADQSEATGFIEGSTASLLMRNYYYNSDRKSGDRDRKDWTQGFTLNYSSGFTQGTVGFGVEAFGNWGIRLDGAPAPPAPATCQCVTMIHRKANTAVPGAP